MNSDVKEVLITANKIKARIKELGQEISKDYSNKFPLLICVLRGAFLFLGDLVREIDIPLSIDFMAISSYNGQTESSGQVKILKDLETPIDKRDVIIIEDIVDTGLTMDAITRLLITRKPKSIKICTLLDKAERRKININIDYYGFRIPNKFVIGYGLDYEEKYRNLPFIGELKEEVYKGGINKKDGK